MDQTPKQFNQKLIDDLENLKIFIDESYDQGDSFDQFNQKKYYLNFLP